MKRIYLDFDGVIADSANECINSAFSVWQSSNKTNSKHLSPFRVKKVIEICIENRHLVVPPEHFFCLVDVTVNEIMASNYEPSPMQISQAFHKQKSLINPIILTQFRKDLFSFRENKFSVQSDIDWFNENPPSKFISMLFDVIKGLDVQTYVVSRKNFVAIKKWECGSPFRFDSICGNELLSSFAGSKFDLVKELQVENKNLPAIFIDDMTAEFESHNWSDISVNTLVAGWGYNDMLDNTLTAVQKVRGYLDDLYY